ncbi:MAG: type III pantothenate kinase [Planctomycetota bacterium]|nr:type III pantothenate kinase [Planctomycetota bacterium]
MGTLVIDIGNTRLAWRLRERSTIVQCGSASHQAISDALSTLPVVEAIAISSVQRSHEDQLQHWIEAAEQPQPIWIRSGADLPASVKTEQPHLTGSDRALCAFAWGGAQQQGPAIIIDAGTAVTVDAVNQSGHLLGGWIAPGWSALCQGLQQAAPSLPEMSDEEIGAAPIPWSGETRRAIRGGIESMFVEGVRGLRQRVQEALGETATTMITGGDADRLLPALQPARAQPNMVLDGLELILEGHRHG